MTNEKLERRRAQRQSIIESFSLFVVLPKKGVHRLKVYDVSTLGMGFDVDIEGEATDEFQMSPGEVLDVHLYLNQSLYLPLKVKIIRISGQDAARRAGGEFEEKNSQGYEGLQAFLQMLQAIAPAARVEAN
ncbi:MAG: hypothetical protein A3K03_05425 [Bdellovibrionales bacterium RIFOXYD1_FULL_44_7]|nr:MAG: hypothetical protein A3K03_05425 [Bdellovibrionales bacterium RIFOXYD1_FULL_44_7]